MRSVTWPSSSTSCPSRCHVSVSPQISARALRIGHAEARSVTSAEQCRARRAAHGIDVVPRQLHALSSELVEIRRRHAAVMKRHVRPAKIVSEDEENVGLADCERVVVGGMATKNAKERKENEWREAGVHLMAVRKHERYRPSSFRGQADRATIFVFHDFDLQRSRFAFQASVRGSKEEAALSFPPEPPRRCVGRFPSPPRRLAAPRRVLPARCSFPARARAARRSRCTSGRSDVKHGSAGRQ